MGEAAPLAPSLETVAKTVAVNGHQRIFETNCRVTAVKRLYVHIHRDALLVWLKETPETSGYSRSEITFRS